jgi:diguanylate cyclase (GGDEF)-like protein
MNPTRPPPPGDSDEEISALIETLHQTGQRLEELTAGEVDTVADHEGRTFLLRRAQDHMRQSEATKQAAVLNALPSHIALLDNQGCIISVNAAWRRFASANVVQGPGYGIGLNYLVVCDSARGDGSSEAHQVAAGIRSVLGGGVNAFSIEYPCHSPTEQRWFLLTVTPLADAHPNGAVVVHVDITERRKSEERIRRLNRVYAVLSGINTLIVHLRGREELFKEACQIAVEKGGFRMALIATVDRSVMKMVPVASAGMDEELLIAIKGHLSSRETASTSMAARAITTKKAIVSNNSQDDPGVSLGKKLAEFGVHSLAVLPLLVAGKAVGVLALHASEREFFRDDELKLLTELADDVAFAIDYIDKQDRLAYLAYYDVLTGLANRTLFLERVAQYMRSAVSGRHKLALYLIDLERFKNINDSLGRPAGDVLLGQVAAWLTRKLEDTNLVARVGADHFAVVLPEINQETNLALLIEKLMKDLLDHPFRLNDAVFRIAVKIGVALYPDDGADADTLYRNAEAALKKAKASRVRCLFYTQKMTAAVAGKLTLENQLRQALDKVEFELHYQPKVNLASGKVTSAEALIRWNDPRTGLVPPDRFIPILEETGLIFEVGRWALRKAIEDYLSWRKSGLAAVRIAVNVSPLQLRNLSFIAEIKQAIGIDAHAAAGLELEITESLIMEDVNHSIASLEAIRAMGVTIAIDDFGTGFSSLSHLSKLPADTLKIDRSFVNDMTVAPEGLALVSTIINLAHSVKLNVVAEGVETNEQARLLRLLNCDEMQGFLFSRPVPAAIFETRYLVPPPAG